MDRFSISLKKEPPAEEIPIEDSSSQALIGIDSDFPPKGVPYRVITHSLENSQMDHEMYMEAIRTAAKYSCDAGLLGERLFSVRLMSNVMTEKFEIQLVFLRK